MLPVTSSIMPSPVLPMACCSRYSVFHELHSYRYRGKQNDQGLSVRILLVTIDRKLDPNWLKDKKIID